MTAAEAGDLVRLLLAGHPYGEKIGRNTVAVYALHLQRFDFEQARLAVLAIQERSTHFPTIAEIVQEIVEVNVGAPPWAIAWEQARSKVVDRDDVELHPLVQQAVTTMGSWEIRHGSAFGTRAYFRQLYEQIVRGEMEEAKQLPAAAETMRALEAGPS